MTPAATTVSGPAATAHSPAKIKFSGTDAFQKTLKSRIDRYFQFTKRSPRDCPQMYVKTGIVLAWFATAYLVLVFAPLAWWAAIPVAVLLGLSMSAIGFNIQHDGGHRAYSRHNWVNSLMAKSLDLLGGSSYVWNHKHNTVHHTHTNITGHDDDIEVGIFARMSPHQKRYAFHKYQHWYLWLMYGFLPVKWQLFDDYWNIARGKNCAYLDLLRGEERYKLRWSSRISSSHRLILGRNLAFWAPYAGYHALRFKVKRYVQSESASRWVGGAITEFRALRRYGLASYIGSGRMADQAKAVLKKITAAGHKRGSR